MVKIENIPILIIITLKIKKQFQKKLKTVKSLRFYDICE